MMFLWYYTEIEKPEQNLLLLQIMCMIKKGERHCSSYSKEEEDEDDDDEEKDLLVS